jgi:hypothetical protein
MMNPRKTVVGVFSNHEQAERAVHELRSAGFADDQIGMARRGTEGEVMHNRTADTGESHAGTGALAGVVTGAGLGALAGWGILAGVIAGGTLAVLLANAAGGAAVAGVLGALIGAGVPEEEAKFYNREFEAGRTIVTVKADGRSDEVINMLRHNGAYDMHTSSPGMETPVVTDTTPPASVTTPPMSTGTAVDVPVWEEDIAPDWHAPTSTTTPAPGISRDEDIRVPVREDQASDVNVPGRGKDMTRP